MRRIVLIPLLAACGDAPRQAFVVDGFVDVTSHPRASVIGLWELRGTPARYYKLGDGIRIDNQFSLAFDYDPPAEALNPDGIGVAFVVMLPEFTTVPDGPVNSAALGIVGISGGTSIIYKSGDATGPAWASSFGARFSCGQCIRNTNALDTYSLIACASVLVENPASPLCEWF